MSSEPKAQLPCARRELRYNSAMFVSAIVPLLQLTVNRNQLIPLPYADRMQPDVKMIFGLDQGTADSLSGCNRLRKDQGKFE